MRWRALAAVVVLGLGLLPAGSATAVGADQVAFDISGQLPEFPCPEGCDATFDGSGSGSGEVVTMIGGHPHVATFTFERAAIHGAASYTEPGFPFCPLVGSAASPTAGSVTLSGQASGTIARTRPISMLHRADLLGEVTGITLVLDFTYTRVGATPAIEITGGSVTLDFVSRSVRTGEPVEHGSLTESIMAGAGGGIFVVDAVEAASRCQDPGPLDFTIEGLASIATGNDVVLD